VSAMLSRLRKELADVGKQKHAQFEDFERIIKKIRRNYGALFPSYKENPSGSKCVYHFGIPDVYPVSLEKAHGSRDCIPPKFVKRAIQGIEDVLTYIEANVPDQTDSNKELENDGPDLTEETSGSLPEPEVPGGDN